MFSKMCTRCRIVKSFFDFSPNNYSRDGKATHCKACHRIDCREYRRRTKEEAMIEKELAEKRIYTLETNLIILLFALIASVGILCFVISLVGKQ